MIPRYRPSDAFETFRTTRSWFGPTTSEPSHLPSSPVGACAEADAAEHITISMTMKCRFMDSPCLPEPKEADHEGGREQAERQYPRPFVGVIEGPAKPDTFLNEECRIIAVV